MVAERMALSHLIYFSRLDLPSGSRERSDFLGEIVRRARARNQAAAITSLLMIDGAFAAQVLEGERSRIRETFERIAVDARHRDVLIVEWRGIAQRAFQTACTLVPRCAENEHVFAKAGLSAHFERGTPKPAAVFDLAAALANGPGAFEPTEPTLI